MKILIVDDGDCSLEPVLVQLAAAGHELQCETENTRHMLMRVDSFRPDLVLINTDSPSRDVLEQLCVLTAHNPLPMVMFSSDSSSQSIAAATDAGVTAYMVQDLDISGLAPILAVAEARFRREQKLREQLEAAALRAEERKIIDTAKGMLMAAHDLSEEDAYRRLQQCAMEQCTPMRTVAERLLRALV